MHNSISGEQLMNEGKGMSGFLILEMAMSLFMGASISIPAMCYSCGGTGDLEDEVLEFTGIQNVFGTRKILTVKFPTKICGECRQINSAFLGKSRLINVSYG